MTFRYSPEVVEALSAEEARRRLERPQALNAVRALARAVDARDPSTRRHSERVADLAVRIAAELGWTADGQRCCARRRSCTTSGKIGVPDAVLFKPGPLTDAGVAPSSRSTPPRAPGSSRTC